MKRLFILTTLIVFVFLLLPCMAGAATYYFSAEGSDTSPYDTWAKASTAIGTFNSIDFANGDVINIRAGDTITDAQLTLAGITGTGKSITIQGLDSDEAGKEKDLSADGKPHFDGNDTTFTGTLILIQNTSIDGTLTIKDIDISGCDGLNNNGGHLWVTGPSADIVFDGIYCDQRSGATTTNWFDYMVKVSACSGDITIRNCTFKNGYYTDFATSRTLWGSEDVTGVMLWNSTPNVKTTGTIRIYNNSFSHIYTDGIHLGGVQSPDKTYIYNNIFNGFGENAVDFKSARYVEFYENVSDQQGDLSFGHADGAGSWGNFHLIAHNDSYNFPGYYSADINIYDNLFRSSNYTGIQGNPGTFNINVYRNRFTDICLPIHVAGTDNMYIYNNVIEWTNAVGAGTETNHTVNSARCGIRIGGSTWDVDDLHIYNNTIVDRGSTIHVYGIYHDGEANQSGLLVKNNLLYMARNDASVYPFYSDGGAAITTDYNNYYNPNHANRITGSTDAHQVVDDPSLANVATGLLYADNDADPIVNAGVSRETDANVPANGLRSVSDWTTLPSINNIQTVSRASYGGADIGAFERETGGAPPGGYTLDVDQDNANDDGQVYSDGGWDSDISGFLYFGDTGSNDQNSEAHFRFVVTGPENGMTIDSAYITFRCSYSRDTGTNVTISAEDADDASDITSVATFNTAVAAQTTATVNWEPGALTAGSDYQTPDLSTIFQEIIDRGATWHSGHQINILIEDNGSTTYEFFKTPSANETNEPVLHIEWSMGTGGPEFDAVGISTVLGGIVTFYENPTAETVAGLEDPESSTGFPGWFWTGRLTKRLSEYATPEPSKCRVKLGPIATSYQDDPYYGHLPDEGEAHWYMLWTPNLLPGHRAVHPQLYGTTAEDWLIMNDAVLEDIDGNPLVLTYAVVDIDGSGEINIGVPYPSTSPKEFDSTTTVAVAQAAGFFFVPGDFAKATEANAISAAGLSDNGTSGHPITFDGGGFVHPGSQTFGDYWDISRIIHGSTVVLGLGDTHKYSLIPSGDILQVPEGATGCTISNDGIRGTLDLDEAANVYNTWIATLDPAGLAADEPVVFYNCGFIESEAVIEAKNALDDLTFTDCLFEISETAIFKDYAGADFNLVRGSAFCDVGYDTGPDTDLNGRPTPRGVHDIGPYEFRGTGLSNLILLLLQ